jgi:hypothetical protein
MLAAGVLESARIVLNSGIGLQEVCIRTSDIFTLPMLRYGPAAASSDIHTLCQIVLNITDSTVCSRPVRLQLYGYNDLYFELLRRRFGRFAAPFSPFLQSVARRLVVGFGYLHSDVSSVIKARLLRDGVRSLVIEGEPSTGGVKIGRAVQRKLFRARRYLRAIPAASLRFDLPGGSYHCGGSFPMRDAPGTGETDRWGRLPGFPNVHIVDASVLPNVPAGPLTLTAMANAHRIASECPL